MKLFLLNILLAVIWTFITGAFSLTNFFVGFVLGYIVLLISSPAIDEDNYTKRFWLVIGLLLFFLKELVVSSVRVAIDVIKPSFKMHSGMVRIPLDAETDLEKTLLANMISLTPGTLSIDLSEDGKSLYIHAMYIDNDDVDAVRREIKNGMEAKILKVTR
jgi:multicomponent Na+:H+ antiporter subunit E